MPERARWPYIVLGLFMLVCLIALVILAVAPPDAPLWWFTNPSERRID